VETILETLLYRRNLYLEFNKQLISKGYTGKDTIINSNMEELNLLIKEESFLVLNDLLRKTYYRLLYP
jgi:hypothetical protein